MFGYWIIALVINYKFLVYINSDTYRYFPVKKLFQSTGANGSSLIREIGPKLPAF